MAGCSGNCGVCSDCRQTVTKDQVRAERSGKAIAELARYGTFSLAPGEVERCTLKGSIRPDKPLISTDSALRKETPMARGLLDYFPAALAEVSRVSFVGNEKHNAGQPLHWSRGKSDDHADCIMRHLVERGKIDEMVLGDGRVFKVRHSAALAWRALALLQLELEAAGEVGVAITPIDNAGKAE